MDDLPKSPFVLFDFKTLFVNAPDKNEALDFFWKNYDAQGYSLYWVQYIKAENEGKILWQTKNLMTGFFERLEHFRKYAFGVHGVYGEEPALDVGGVYVWRGVGEPAEVKELDQYEYHIWTKLDEKNEEHKKKVKEFWTNLKEGDIVEGKTVQAAKYFK